jgi:hypothetical protein
MSYTKDHSSVTTTTEVKQMTREIYNSPVMEVYVFEEKDVIVCSFGEDHEVQDPDENEDF